MLGSALKNFLVSSYCLVNSASRDFTLSDHKKDCTVTSSRLSNISRRILYSSCNSCCTSSRSFHSLSVNSLVTSGSPTSSRGAVFNTSVNLASSLEKSFSAVISSGGFSKFNATNISFRSFAVSLSSTSISMEVEAFWFLASINLPAANSAAKKSNKANLSCSVPNRSFTLPVINRSFMHPNSLRKQLNSNRKELESSGDTIEWIVSSMSFSIAISSAIQATSFVNSGDFGPCFKDSVNLVASVSSPLYPNFFIFSNNWSSILTIHGKQGQATYDTFGYRIRTHCHNII